MLVLVVASVRGNPDSTNRVVRTGVGMMETPIVEQAWRRVVMVTAGRKTGGIRRAQTGRRITRIQGISEVGNQGATQQGKYN